MLAGSRENAEKVKTSLETTLETLERRLKGLHWLRRAIMLYVHSCMAGPGRTRAKLSNGRQNPALEKKKKAIPDRWSLFTNSWWAGRVLACFIGSQDDVMRRSNIFRAYASTCFHNNVRGCGNWEVGNGDGRYVVCGEVQPCANVRQTFIASCLRHPIIFLSQARLRP
jgi:hypothetical protein